MQHYAASNTSYIAGRERCKKTAFAQPKNTFSLGLEVETPILGALPGVLIAMRPGGDASGKKAPLGCLEHCRFSYRAIISLTRPGHHDRVLTCAELSKAFPNAN